MTASLIHSGAEDQAQSSSRAPYADTMLQVARQGYSFQTRQVRCDGIAGAHQRTADALTRWRLARWHVLWPCRRAGRGPSV